MFKQNLVITIFVTAIILCGIYSYQHFTANQKEEIHTIGYVSGKPLSEIQKQFNQVGQEMKFMDGIKAYHFYEEDQSAGYMFQIDSNGNCLRQFIKPADNYVLEKYIHYLNEHAEEYIRDARKSYTIKEGDITAEKIIGQWRIIDNGHWTNIFMISGEIRNPMYFLNTSEEIPYWLAQKP